jgi:hypothetical protein
MDGLKLYNSLTDTVKCFSTITNIRKGKVKNQQRKYKDLEELQPEETHKYLGIP